MTKNHEICFACGEGEYREVQEDYAVELPGGEVLTVPKLTILRCEKCGEETVPPESSRRIEAAVDEHQDTLSPGAVRSFLDQFHVDQTEAAEALGMGSKTFHRWARGTQKVSRSMGYFLRALMAHPAVYDWIRNRSWRRASRKETEFVALRLGGYWESDYSIRFPASGGRVGGVSFSISASPRKFNAARGLLSASIR